MPKPKSSSDVALQNVELNEIALSKEKFSALIEEVTEILYFYFSQSDSKHSSLPKDQSDSKSELAATTTEFVREVLP